MDRSIRLVGGQPGAPPQIERHRQTYFVGVYRRNRLRAIKVGLCTKGRVNTRLKNLQTGSVDELRLLAVVDGNLERKLHREFAGYRLEGEFFRPAPRILRLIEDLKKLRELVKQFEKRNL